MKTAFELAVLIIFVAACGGCASALTRHAAPESLPVTSGAASTNDTQMVAWLELSRAANRAFNPTPSQPLVDTVLGASIAVAGALGGWFTRHQLQKKVDATWDEAKKDVAGGAGG